MAEHPVAHQRLERRAGEVGGVPDDQEMREAVAAELADRILRHRQGLVVGCEGAGFMHRADLHADLRRIVFLEDRLDDLEENPGASLYPAAIRSGGWSRFRNCASR
jgi:hypothetical protein